MKRAIICLPVFLSIIIFMIGGCGGGPKYAGSTADEQFRHAKKEYDKGHYLNAIDLFQRVLFNFPGATVVDTAQYYLAHSYYGNKEYELAAVEFSRLLTNYPRSPFIDNAQYMVGVCYLKNTPKHYGLDQEDLKKSMDALEDFIIDNPDSPLIEDAKKSILEARTKLARKAYSNGMTYLKMYSYKAARIYFQMVIDDYTDTEYASRALFKIAESYFKEKKYSEAEGKFGNFLTLYPDNEWIPKAREYLEEISYWLSIQNASGESE